MLICKVCGYKEFEDKHEACRYSLTRKHMMIQEIPEGYFCQHCGYTSYTCELGDCPHSPAKKHVYIGQKPAGSPYICKFCGWEPSYVMGGPCKMAPHGFHEFM
jgi:hypothetical protein